MHSIRYMLLGAAMFLAMGIAAASAQTNSKKIMAQSPAELIDILKKADSPTFDKAKACQRLAITGSKDAVPALAALLDDEKLNLYARCGLEGIADPSADKALREATKRLQGRQLAGVLNSIGHRQDPQAITLLKHFARGGDVMVAQAAAGALARIATPEAATALRELLEINAADMVAVAESCVICAQRLAAKGKKVEAAALYQVTAKSNVPKHIKAAAILENCRLQQPGAKDLLLMQIRNPENVFFNVGLALAREIPGADLTASLVEELKNLPPERHALLLTALGDRKDQPPAALFSVAIKSQSPAVREAAIRVLAKRGDASSVETLLDFALNDVAVAATTKECLKAMPGGTIDAIIGKKLAAAEPKAKVVLFELIGDRQIVETLPAVRTGIDDADASVRLAAISALGQLAELDDVDLLAAKTLAGSGEARAALNVAAMRMSDPDACAEKLAGRLKGASAENKAYLLELLGKVSGKKALEIMAAAAKSSDPATKDSATKVLGEWVSADAAPALLEIVKTDADKKYQTRALRGYIRIARQLQLPPETKLSMFRTAMELGQTNDKKVALDILTRIPSSETLELAASFAGDPALNNAAADAAVKIGTKILGSEPKAVVAAMQKLTAANIGGDIGDRAKQLLGQAQAAAK